MPILFGDKGFAVIIDTLLPSVGKNPIHYFQKISPSSLNLLTKIVALIHTPSISD